MNALRDHFEVRFSPGADAARMGASPFSNGLRRVSRGQGGERTLMARAGAGGSPCSVAAAGWRTGAAESWTDAAESSGHTSGSFRCAAQSPGHTSGSFRRAAQSSGHTSGSFRRAAQSSGHTGGSFRRAVLAPFEALEAVGGAFEGVSRGRASPRSS